MKPKPVVTLAVGFLALSFASQTLFAQSLFEQNPLVESPSIESPLVESPSEENPLGKSPFEVSRAEKALLDNDSDEQNSELPVAREDEPQRTLGSELEEPRTLETTAADTRRDLTDIEQAIYSIESEFDAYDPALTELSQALAARLSAIGQHNEALVAYRRALHVLRINEGLHSDRQIPILEDIVETHYKAGQHEEAGDILNRLSALYSRNIGNNDKDKIATLVTRGQWHLSATGRASPLTRMRHLQEAFNAYSRVAFISQRTGLPYDSDVYNILISTTYQLAAATQDFQSRPTSFEASRNASRDLLARELQNSSTSVYRRGKKTLEAAIKHAENSENPEHKILATVNMADWEQLFRKRFAAKQGYLEAYRQLQVLGDDNHLKTLFDDPRRLPDFGTFNRASGVADAQKLSVNVSTDVSPWGTPRSSKIFLSENSSEQDFARNSVVERRALRQVSSAIYRPRIVNGEMVNARNFVQTVTFLTPNL